MNVPTSSDNHAIVIGGSIAGLGVARVLRDHFARVTIIERDALDDGPEARSGVPQGRQFHILLRRGLDIYDSLFPGFRSELLAAGAEPVVWGRDLRWYHFGGWKRRNDAGFESVFCSRLLIESRLRRRLLADPRVTIRSQAVVSDLAVDAARRRVVGVVIEPKGTSGGARETLTADLVVDASGRESKAPVWLAGHGHEPPTETVVNAKLGYVTRYFRRRHDLPDWKALIIHATPPAHTRLGALAPIEGDRWQLVMAGVNGDYPPTDEEGLMDFARSLASPEIHEAIRGAEPLSPIYGYRRTENRMRRFDRLPSYLERFVVLGDAVCAFNPVYAQGMSTAVQSASLLGDCLRERHGDLDDLPRSFQKRLYRMLLTPWFLATSEDFRYPTTIGERPPAVVPVLQRFIDQVLCLSTVDARAYEAFVNVMHMTRLPTTLLQPAILLGALTGRSAGLAASSTAMDAGWSAPRAPAAAPADSAAPDSAPSKLAEAS